MGHAQHGRGRREPELLLGGQYGHQLHVWDLRAAATCRRSTWAPSSRWCSSCGPAHDPNKAYGFVGVVVSPEGPVGLDLAVVPRARHVGVRKVIEIPAEPADADELPPLLKRFGAVPPLVTDINLSVDDRFLYVSCWGTGELRQYDVSDPFNPRETGSVHLGGIVGARPHPAAGPLNGGPQMVEVEPRRAARLPHQLALPPWDAQFYPDGIQGWMAKLDAGEDGGGARPRPFFVEFEGERPHQVRLQGGDASSDSYCFPPERTPAWPLAGARLLGAYHGVNPAMGWLFAVALGLQERSRRAVCARWPIALGHELRSLGRPARGRPRAARSPIRPRCGCRGPRAHRLRRFKLRRPRSIRAGRCA